MYLQRIKDRFIKCKIELHQCGPEKKSYRSFSHPRQWRKFKKKLRWLKRIIMRFSSFTIFGRKIVKFWKRLTLMFQNRTSDTIMLNYFLAQSYVLSKADVSKFQIFFYFKLTDLHKKLFFAIRYAYRTDSKKKKIIINFMFDMIWNRCSPILMYSILYIYGYISFSFILWLSSMLIGDRLLLISLQTRKKK